MTEYRWKGIDQQGKSCRGKMFATTVSSLQKQLHEQGIALLEYRQSSLNTWFKKKIHTHQQITMLNLAHFFEQLSILLESGIPLSSALQTCSVQARPELLQKIIEAIIIDIHHGETFSHALSKHSTILPSSITSPLRNAEQTGSLSIICKDLSEYLTANQAIKTSVKHALLVPTITAIFAVGITLSILFFIVPHFEQLFQASHAALPVMTRRLFFLSTLLRSKWGLTFLSGSLLLLATSRFVQFRKLKRIFFGGLIKIPYINNIFFATLNLNFLSTLYLYVQAGLPLDLGVEQAQKMTTNTDYQAFLESIKISLTQGNSLESSLRKSKFPYLHSPTIISLIGVGEQSGNLQEMLKKSRTWQYSELMHTMNRISSLAGPFFMLLLGSFIAGLLITIYSPIFNLAMRPHL